MARFRNRQEAARELADVLANRNYSNPIVLGIPRGGVPVADEVARRIRGTPGVVVARKLRAPQQPELAIGAVAANGAAYVNERLAREVGADRAYVEREIAYQAADAQQREARFDGAHQAGIAGRTVIVVDDGIATGSTAIAALRSVRAAGAARVVLAVPVGPPETIRALAAEADDVVCPRVERDFYAVGQFYDDFAPVTDDEVDRIVLGWRAGAGEALHQDAVIQRDGVRLAVRLAIPPGSQPAPVVVFIHGLGSSKDSPRNVDVAARLLGAGFATVLFDLSGHGESDADPRGVAAFVDDTVAVVGLVAHQARIDSSRIALAGSSVGAAVALQAVRAASPAPAVLVLRAPAIEARDIRAVGVPTLVVIGSHDPRYRELAGACRVAEGVTLEVVDGAGHLFEEPGTLDRAIDATVAWLLATSPARPTPNG